MRKLRQIRLPILTTICVGGMILAIYKTQAQDFDAPNISGQARPQLREAEGPGVLTDSPVGTPSVSQPSQNLPYQPMKQVQRTRTVVETQLQPLTPDELRQRAEINKAVHDLSDDDVENREAAAKELQRLLGDAFDRDMRDRERKLQELEERVAKLRDAYQMRLDARDEIITHRVRGYELHAQGLAYPEGVAPNALPTPTRTDNPVRSWNPVPGNTYQLDRSGVYRPNNGQYVLPPKSQPPSPFPAQPQLDSSQPHFVPAQPVNPQRSPFDSQRATEPARQGQSQQPPVLQPGAAPGSRAPLGPPASAQPPSDRPPLPDDLIVPSPERPVPIRTR